MIVVIKEREIREGAKGDYLYIKYTTEKGKDGGKAVFSQLREKWDLCQPNKAVDLKLDEKYNVVDINKVEIPAVVKEAVRGGAKIVSVEKKSDKNKAFALSYAKDIAVALINNGKLEKNIAEAVIDTAEKFDEYLNS